MRPLDAAALANRSSHLANKHVHLDDYYGGGGGLRVRAGLPVAQYYGLGDLWRQWAERVCGPSSPCARVTAPHAWRYYSVGPPYIATVSA